MTRTCESSGMCSGDEPIFRCQVGIEAPYLLR